MTQLTLPFLVIGAGKAGATTLHSLLSSVADIFMSTTKELLVQPAALTPSIRAPGAPITLSRAVTRRIVVSPPPTAPCFQLMRNVAARIRAVNPNMKDDPVRHGAAPRTGERTLTNVAPRQAVGRATTSVTQLADKT